MKKIIYAPQALIDKWRVWFLNDVSKFMNPSCLLIEDLGKEFLDSKGNKWQLLGSLETKEVGCRNLETGKIWSWDRWKVSLILRPEEHARLKNIFKIDRIVKAGVRPAGYDPITHKELQFEAQRKAAALIEESAPETTPPTGTSVA